MSKKEHEALDQRDLHGDIAQPHGDEVEQSKQAGLMPAATAAMERKWEHQEYEYGGHGDHQQHSQHDHAQVDPPVHAAPGSGQDVANDVPCLQREEEERGAVADWSDVVGVVAGELPRIVGIN